MSIIDSEIVSISNWKPFIKGKMQGFFTLTLPLIQLKINDCKLMKNDDGTYWIAFPSKAYEENGETKYFRLVEIYDQGIQQAAIDQLKFLVM